MGKLGIAAAVALCAAYSLTTYAHKSEPGFTDLSDALKYPTTNCEGLILLAPREGTQFRDTHHSFPPEVQSFFERAAERHATWERSQNCTSTVREAVPSPVNEGPDSIQATGTANWSGFQQTNANARYAQAGWVVPTAAKPTAPPEYTSPDGRYTSSTWVGIGDHCCPSQTPPLIQAGSLQNIPAPTGSPPTQGPPQYSLFYEVFPANIVNLSIPVTAQNYVSVAVAYSGTSAWIGVCNESLVPERCLSGQQITPVSTPDGSAEWIEESALGSAYLANFGSVTFHNMCSATAYTPGQPVSPCNALSAPLSIYIKGTERGHAGMALTSNSGAPGMTGTITWVFYEPQ